MLYYINSTVVSMTHSDSPTVIYMIILIHREIKQDIIMSIYVDVFWIKNHIYLLNKIIKLNIQCKKLTIEYTDFVYIHTDWVSLNIKSIH